MIELIKLIGLYDRYSTCLTLKVIGIIGQKVWLALQFVDDVTLFTTRTWKHPEVYEPQTRVTRVGVKETFLKFADTNLSLVLGLQAETCLDAPACLQKGLSLGAV